MSSKEYYHLKELLKEIKERMDYLLREQDKYQYDPVGQSEISARYNENKVIHDKIKDIIIDFQLGNEND